jgi:hypothetical protein
MFFVIFERELKKKEEEEEEVRICGRLEVKP